VFIDIASSKEYALMVSLDSAPSIGQRVRELRQAKGWAFDRLARETGLSRGTLWEAEHKKDREPRHRTLVRIAEALGVPVEYLRDGKMPAAEEDLSSYSPDVYARAQGLKNPDYVQQWAEYLSILRRIEAEKERGPAEERGLESYSPVEFARAKGLQDEEKIARFQAYLEHLLAQEELEGQ
jgi:transcriptional regulator with XRE-family HTH domain